jgi:hypothetical protein
MLQDDFSKYHAMKAAGASPDEVYQVAARDGIDFATMFRLIRSVFALSFVEAKEVIVIGQGWASSLKEYQDQIADEFASELEKIERGESVDPEDLD